MLLTRLPVLKLANFDGWKDWELFFFFVGSSPWKKLLFLGLIFFEVLPLNLMLDAVRRGISAAVGQ